MDAAEIIAVKDTLADLRRLGFIYDDPESDRQVYTVSRRLAAEEAFWQRLPALIIDIPKEEVREILRYAGTFAPPES